MFEDKQGHERQREGETVKRKHNRDKSADSPPSTGVMGVTTLGRREGGRSRVVERTEEELWAA